MLLLDIIKNVSPFCYTIESNVKANLPIKKYSNVVKPHLYSSTLFQQSNLPSHLVPIVLTIIPWLIIDTLKIYSLVVKLKIVDNMAGDMLL